MSPENGQGKQHKRKRPGPGELQAFPKAGDVIILADTPYYAGGTVPRRKSRDIQFPYPLDLGEGGTGWNAD